MTRNRTLIKGFALAALMPLFAACSSEDDAIVQGGEAQPVQIDITRATTDGNNWTWENGDQLKLYVTSYGSDAPTEETLIYGGSTWSTFNATLPATVEACYPATATLTSFTIPENQVAGIAAADYMTTASSQQLNGTNLSLTLEHRLCKVTVTISGYEDYTAAIPTVSDERIKSYPTVSYNNGNWTGTGTAVTDIIPLKTASNMDGHHTYQAIVAPASSYSPFMTLMVNGKDRTVNCNQALVSGNAYTFNLTVRNPDAATRSAGTSDYELELVEVRDLNEE